MAVQIVTARHQGEHDLLRTLFARHYEGLCRLGFVLLGDAAAAEDVVQEAFARTLAGASRIRDPERADVYLRRAVVNECRSRFRRRATEARANSAAYRRSYTITQSDVDRSNTGMVVLDAVRKLAPRQRLAVVLRYYCDLPEAEIAEAMGCSAGTVKSQLFKARATLEKVLDDPQSAPRGEE